MAHEKILTIEDDADFRSLLEETLRREGFTVLAAGAGAAGFELALAAAPQLIILDLGLPDIHGLDLCRKFREEPLTRATPLVMLSADGDEDSVVRGLELGADDFVVKPFRPAELGARLRTALRRAGRPAAEETAERIVADALVLDTVGREATLAGAPLLLTATEFRLLHLLTSNPGRVFTRDQILARVIAGGVVVGERNIDVHVRALRRKLGAFAERIETSRGVGYRFRETALPLVGSAPADPNLD
ncbi:MAG: response regulator transcription factor [Planctomycetes bacterium]|nr:response regulator transcription factor [Planctomycetota bacterium]